MKLAIAAAAALAAASFSAPALIAPAHAIIVPQHAKINKCGSARKVCEAARAAHVNMKIYWVSTIRYGDGTCRSICGYHYYYWR